MREFLIGNSNFLRTITEFFDDKFGRWFIHPVGLLGLIGIPIILIIYILKSRYTPKPVSSTFIWKRSLQYTKRKFTFKIVFSLLLILQILTIVAATLAYARPQITPFKSEEKIIIIDASASMMTSDGEKTRFELAQERAIELADTAGNNSRITVITAGEEASEILHRSISKSEVIKEVQNLSCTVGKTDIEGALVLANLVQEQNYEAQIYFLTDRSYAEAKNLTVENFASDEDNNVAILSFTSQMVLKNYAFTAKMISYKEDCDVNVDLVVDGDVVATKKISLTAGEEKELNFTASSNSGYLANPISITGITSFQEAKLQIELTDDEVINGIAQDDTYYLYSNASSSPKVLYVSSYFPMEEDKNGNMVEMTNSSTYLLSVLKAVGYNVRSDSVFGTIEHAEKFFQTAGKELYTGYDLYVFEGVVPKTLPQDGAVWIIGPDTATDSLELGFEFGEKQTGVFPLDSAVDTTKSSAYSTLLRNIQPTDVSAGEYRAITAYDEADFIPILTIENQPVLMVGKIGTLRVVYSSLDFHFTNMPTMIYYPLLINNMATYSTPEIVKWTNYYVGDTVSFYAPIGCQKVSLYYRDTMEEDAEDYEVLSFGAKDNTFTLDMVGVYYLDIHYENGNEKKVYLPCNLPTDELNPTVEEVQIEALGVSENAKVDLEKIDVLPYLILILLILIITEWGVYYRDEF